MCNNDQGIAIGPILFVVAILGILAAAIAAGSGSFTGNTQTESAKSKAAAIIEMGQTLKFGWDRMIANGIEPANVVIDSTATTNDNHLFAPAGGGVTPPSNVLASSGGRWCYFTDDPQNGVIVMLPVSLAECQQINILVGVESTSIPFTSYLFDESLCHFDDMAIVTELPVDFIPKKYQYCIAEGSSPRKHIFIQYLYSPYL